MSEPMAWILLISLWAGMAALKYSSIILIPTIFVSTCFSAYGLNRQARTTKIIGWLTLLAYCATFNELRVGRGESVNFIFATAFIIFSVIIYWVVSQISNFILKGLKTRNATVQSQKDSGHER